MSSGIAVPLPTFSTRRGWIQAYCLMSMFTWFNRPASQAEAAVFIAETDAATAKATRIAVMKVRMEILEAWVSIDIQN